MIPGSASWDDPELMDVVVCAITAEVREFYGSGAGLFREPTSNFQCWAGGEVYRRSDLCSWWGGYTCKAELPEGCLVVTIDGEEFHPQMCLQPAHRKSWKQKTSHRAEVARLKEQAELGAWWVEEGSEKQKMFHTWVLNIDTAVAAYSNTALNVAQGFQRHYGLKTKECNCRSLYNAAVTQLPLCDMCLLWDEAILNTEGVWDGITKNLELSRYVCELKEGPASPPVGLYNLVGDIAEGKILPTTLSSFEDDYGLLSWWNGISSKQRAVYGPGIYAYLDGTYTQFSSYSMSVFVKWEKATNLSPGGASKLLKYPRLVCPSADPSANLVTGPIFKAASDALKMNTREWLNKSDLTHPLPEMLTTSGFTALEVGYIARAAWFQGYDKCGEFDLSSLDASQNGNFARQTDSQVKKIACKVMKWTPECETAFLCFRKRLVKTKYGKFEYISGECSGFAGTFVCNTIGCVTAILGRCKQFVLNEGLVSVKFMMLALGDDSLVFTSGLTLSQFNAMMTQVPADMIVMGLFPKPVVSLTPSFCSALFWPLLVNGEETLVLAPEVLRLLSRVGMSLSVKTGKFTHAEARALNKGLVLSNRAWAGLPILRVLHRVGMAIREDAKFDLEPHKSYTFEEADYGISQYAEGFLEKTYGWNRAAVVELETQLLSTMEAAQGGPCFIRSSLLAQGAHHFAVVRDAGRL